MTEIPAWICRILSGMALVFALFNPDAPKWDRLTPFIGATALLSIAFDLARIAERKP